jgi:hypothetical protein
MSRKDCPCLRSPKGNARCSRTQRTGNAKHAPHRVQWRAPRPVIFSRMPQTIKLAKRSQLYADHIARVWGTDPPALQLMR